MTFPERNWLGSRKEWQDLGEIEGQGEIIDGKIFIRTTSCGFCNRTVHIGKEANMIFKFCPRCLVKTKTE